MSREEYTEAGDKHHDELQPLNEGREFYEKKEPVREQEYWARVSFEKNFHKVNRAFGALSAFLLSNHSSIQEVIELASIHNPWFTPWNTKAALMAIARSLKEENVEKWLRESEGLLQSIGSGKGNNKRAFSVGLVLAGNIPAVGFHDILCVLASGHYAKIKLSRQDSILIPFLLKQLCSIDSTFNNFFEFQERLTGFDAIIASGSTNSARYFDFYFGKYPHIIRKNRNSVAILTGKESMQDLQALGNDIFLYYGLGCRNVSKLYIPRAYSFDAFFLAIEPWRKVLDLHKYLHNYDYQLTLVLINSIPHLTNGFVILTDHASAQSPISVLHYEYYDKEDELIQQINEQLDQFQCVVSKNKNYPLSQEFGSTQNPALWDYADRVNTMRFLTFAGCI